MRIIVTGAAGFIGAAVCSQFLDQGHEVVGVDCFLDILYPAAVKSDRQIVLSHRENFSFAHLDLRCDDLNPLLDGIDVLVHLAALPGLSLSWNDFRSYQDCNVLSVQRLLDALVGRPEVHLVHISTSSVYGATATSREDSELKPVSPYGITKAAAENLVGAYAREFSLRTSILRYFSVYGPDQRPDMAFAKFCDNLLRGQPISITGDGSHSRSITYISDIANATVLAAESQLDGAVLNIAGSWEISVLDAVSILADELHVDPHIRFVSPRPGDQLRTHGVIRQAHALLGWEPHVSPESGLRQQARRALEHYSSPEFNH